MKNLFLQKLLLLLVLFLGGCSVDSLIYIVAGQTGVYTKDGIEHTFTISDDAETYEDSDYLLTFSLRSQDSMVYTGYDKDGYLITVKLSSLSGLRGVYSIYKESSLLHKIGFSWTIVVTTSTDDPESTSALDITAGRNIVFDDLWAYIVYTGDMIIQSYADTFSITT